MVRLLWTKNHKIGSYLIRWGTQGDCSHFAVEFDDCIIMQSTMLQGVTVVSTNEFMKHNEIVHQISFNTSVDKEELVWVPMVKRFAGKTSYDFKAMAYWAFCVLKQRLFGDTIPVTNKMGDPDKFMCIEVAGELPDWVFGGQKPMHLDITSPEMLFHLIDEGTKNADIRAH